MKNNDDCMVLIKKGIKPALFCIHSVSGSSTIYRHMKSPIMNSLYGLNAIGVHFDVQPEDTIVEMANTYLQQIRRIQPLGPYHICGFSMGGLIAYEIACQLQSHGEAVSLLGLIDVQVTIARKNDAEELLSGYDGWITFINILFGNVDQRFYNLDCSFWKYNRQKKLDCLLKLKLEKHDNRHPKTIDAEWLDKCYTFYCAMNKANIDYELGEFGSDLIYFATSDGSHIQSVKNIRTRVTGNVKVINIEGSHLNLFSDETHATTLGSLIAKELNCQKATR
ncbi:thioesterase domain-containing protein [Lentilitoribacter sp. EG35]|uniref:thioesterase domain-containing protein n=1 Tax=Lentilitoribacter sp. EG35 TaxID=3234192 RepID=UPI00345FACB8